MSARPGGWCREVSPNQPEFVRLVAQLRNDVATLDRLAARLDPVDPKPPWEDDAHVLFFVAVTLEHYYTGFETVAERVVRAFEGMPLAGADWHKELLETVSLDLPGIRPALVGPGTLEGLRELLGFRHVLRHAYAVSLRPTRLAELVDVLNSLHPRLREDLDRFIDALVG